MASIAMTEQTPNTMPSAVRSERSLWSQRLLTPRRTVRLSRSNHGPRITPIDANELVENSDMKQFSCQIVEYRYHANVPFSPHPAFGHPLPIRWGEGRVRGVAVSNLLVVIRGFPFMIEHRFRPGRRAGEWRGGRGARRIRRVSPG